MEILIWLVILIVLGPVILSLVIYAGGFVVFIITTIIELLTGNKPPDKRG